MIRSLAWILTATLALAACGAGDRKPEQEKPVTNPTARPSPVQAAAGGETATNTTPAAPDQAAATPSSALTKETAVHPDERLYTVQIAAYHSADSARALADKLTQRGLPVWTMEVRVGERTFHRIRVGAHPELGAMRKLGAQISSQFKQQVWVAPIDMAARIPVSAVADTRALLARQ